MTHSTTTDTPGDYEEGTRQTDLPCPKCSGVVVVRRWESSCGGWTDYRYDCTVCSHGWWVEGSDA